MATGTAGSTLPSTVNLGDVMTPQQFADAGATETALWQTLTGGANAKSFKGLILDGTGGVTVAPAARTIQATGGVLTLLGGVDLPSGNLTLGSGGIQMSGASAALSLPHNYGFGATVNTTDATVTTLASFQIPVNEAAIIIAQVVGRKDDTTCASYLIAAGFRNNAGTVVQVGATATLLSVEDDAAWGGATFDVSTDFYRVRVQGLAGTTVHWKAWVWMTRHT